MTKAQLINYTPLIVSANAIRTCYQSFGKSDSVADDEGKCPDGDLGEKDKGLIHRVGNQFRHASTLEHLTYTFYLTISRAVLQELARHRHASLSVKSTRYTLKELKKEEPFGDDVERIGKYVILTEDERVNRFIVQALENLRLLVIDEDTISNDLLKYALPEAYKTELTWTINARSLQNFLNLRSSKQALWEIRDLANAVFDALPQEHKYLFEEFMNA